MLLASSNPLEFQFLPFITTVVVSLIVFVVLGTVVWPKILKGLNERDAKILHEIESAEAARAGDRGRSKKHHEFLVRGCDFAKSR